MDEMFDNVDSYYKGLTVKEIFNHYPAFNDAKALYGFLSYAYPRRMILGRIQFDGGYIEKTSDDPDYDGFLNIHCKLSPEACDYAYSQDFDLSETSWTFNLGFLKESKIQETPPISGLELLSLSTVEVNPYMAWPSEVMKKYVGN